MSIRVRLTLVFALLAAILGAIGGEVFIRTFAAALIANVDSQLTIQVAQAPRTLGAAAPSGRAVPLPGEFLLQVVDPAGVVRRASSDAGDAVLLPPALLSEARSRRLAVTTSEEGEALRVVAAPVRGRPGWVAIAAVSLAATTRTVANLTREIALGGVILLLLTSGGAFALAGAALAPVERLRVEAALRSRERSAHRLAVPATHDELARLAETLNELLGRLAGALERQRRLVADASHELRTPLAILRAELELASRPGRTRDELAAAMDSAAREAERLTRLTDDLLLLARRDADRLAITREPVELGPLLAESVARFAPRAHGVRITADAGADATRIAWLDPERIRQALDNLIENALRVAPPGSTIAVTGAVDGDRLVLGVSDAGPGFPPEFLPHAFEPFRRPDDGRGRASGSAGLGLAIVAAIAEAHGGRAGAENRPGAGAVVRLEIPLARGSDSGAAALRAGAPRESGAARAT